MKFFTTEEATAWCESHGLQVTADQYLQYDGERLSCFTVGLEDKPSRVIALADHLVPTWEDVSFGGALLWFNNWGIWGDFSENAGAMIVQQMRRGQGETSPLTVTPGHLFGSHERLEMHAFFAIPLLFGWDAFLVPEGQDYFIFVSHDGALGVVSRTPETAEHVRHRVRSWNPQDCEGWYNRFVNGIPS